jgi:hypothetical protein
VLIHRHQRDVLRSAGRASVEAELSAYLRRELPDPCDRLPRADLSAAVHLGVDRALAHGFDNRRHVAVYLTLMVYFGSDLDDDPVLPWVAAALRRPRVAPAELVRELQTAALEHLEAAEGERNEHLDAARARLRRMPFDALLPPFAGGAEPYVMDRLRAFHPPKCAVAGDEALAALARRAIPAARQAGFASPQGAALHAGLMLMLGVGFAADPFIPWAARAVARAAAEPPAARDFALHQALVAHVSHPEGDHV